MAVESEDPPTDAPTIADRVREIVEDDVRPTPTPGKLRLQWNVPRGVQPNVPLWLTLLFLALVAVPVIVALLR